MSTAMYGAGKKPAIMRRPGPRFLTVRIEPVGGPRPNKSLRRKNFAEPLDRAQHLLLRQPRPLAAHDEVIDPEQLAIPGDLLLHRDLVTDDEPVAREILEGLRGAIFQPPGGVGVVFVFERAAAFLMCRRVAFANIAFDSDRVFDRRAAVFLERGSGGLHPRHH